MKLDPINPAPPVTRIVFSISSNFGFGSTRPLATPPPGERTAIVNKKDGIHPVLLLLHRFCPRATCSLAYVSNRQLASPLSRPSLPCGRSGCSPVNRPSSPGLSQFPTHHFEIHALDLPGDLRPLIMFPDALFRGPSRCLAHRRIRNQKLQPVRQVPNISGRRSVKAASSSTENKVLLGLCLVKTYLPLPILMLRGGSTVSLRCCCRRSSWSIARQSCFRSELDLRPTLLCYL